MTESECVVIGTAADCDHVIVDPYASKHHAHVRRTATGYTVEDLRSTNGIVLHYQRSTWPPVPDSLANWRTITGGQSVDVPRGTGIRVGRTDINLDDLPWPAKRITQPDGLAGLSPEAVDALIKAGEELRQVFVEAGERIMRSLVDANRGIAEAMRRAADHLDPKGGTT